MEKIKKPLLRFRGFTDTWEQCKFKDLFVKLQNNSLSRADLNDENGYAMNVHYGDVLIKFNEILDVNNENIPYITEPGIIEKYKSSFLQNGDIIIADAAEDNTVGKCCEIAGLSHEIVLAGLHTIPCRPSKNFASGYLGYYMNSNVYHDQLLPLIQGSKISSISINTLANTSLVYPKSIEEQLLLANKFRALDSIITLHQRKYDKLVNVKKALLDKMFPKNGEVVPKLRFKGFNETWEQRELESLTIKLDNLRVPVSEVDRVPGPTPYYGANGIQGYVQGYTHKGEFILVAEDGANDLKNYPVQYVNGEVWVNNHAHVLQGKLDFADTRYLGYAISQTNIEPFLVGGGRAKLNASTMMKIMISSPQNTQEQQRIGSLFDSIDSLITLHQCKYDQLIRIKKALLQKMFV